MQVMHLYADRKLTSSFIRESVNADAASVRSVLSKLAKARLVRTTRGRGGSCELARSGDQISLLDIYKATSAPQVFAVHSYPVEPNCIVSTHHKQTMERLLGDCQKAVEETLAGKKLPETLGPMSRKK